MIDVIMAVKAAAEKELVFAEAKIAVCNEILSKVEIVEHQVDAVEETDSDDSYASEENTI